MRKVVFFFAIVAAIYALLVSCTQVPPKSEPTPVATPTPKPPAPIPTPVPTVPPMTGSLEEIKAIASESKCAAYNWNDRGRAPKGYMKGMALTFAKAVCNPTRDDVVLVSQANSGDDVKDVISWYNSNYKALGMDNDKAGMHVVRHVYTLLIGLGMRESSGKYCCGRDMSADFSTATSAEAGTFQASWGARRVAPALMDSMLAKYKGSRAGCYLDVFKEGVGTCSEGNLKNWGEGEGVVWQATTKGCPAYSAEYAAILLRKTGGTKGEFGPLRRKAAELNPDCEKMLRKVQDLVEAKPALCKIL